MRQKAPESPRLIWQYPTWPGLRYDGPSVAAAVAAARNAHGVAEGKLSALGFEQRQEFAADAWTQDALSTAAIEGERLDLLAVRSSVARRLGVAMPQSVGTPRHVDGLLDAMDDAVRSARSPLTHERLHGWQAALFPTGYSGITKIRVGGYRTHEEPMQIMSGPMGRERIHYHAPASRDVPREMDQFLDWFNADDPQMDPLVKAAIAHLWFETIHPFEDGNGRVGRVVVDLVLARDAGEASRLVRLSARLHEKRREYYQQLEHAQHSAPENATAWVIWFVDQVRAGCLNAITVIDMALVKAQFWSRHADKNLGPRQRKVINVLLEAGPRGYDGGMSTRKYENLTRASRATASRDLSELVALGLLRSEGAARATRYGIAIEGWNVRPATESPAGAQQGARLDDDATEVSELP